MPALNGHWSLHGLQPTDNSHTYPWRSRGTAIREWYDQHSIMNNQALSERVTWHFIPYSYAFMLSCNRHIRSNMSPCVVTLFGLGVPLWFEVKLPIMMLSFPDISLKMLVVATEDNLFILQNVLLRQDKSFLAEDTLSCWKLLVLHHCNLVPLSD